MTGPTTVLGHRELQVAAHLSHKGMLLPVAGIHKYIPQGANRIRRPHPRDSPRERNHAPVELSTKEPMGAKTRLGVVAASHQHRDYLGVRNQPPSVDGTARTTPFVNLVRPNPRREDLVGEVGVKLPLVVTCRRAHLNPRLSRPYL